MYQVTLLGSQYAVVTVPAHAAADLTADHPIFRAPCACRIVSVTIVPGATITGANTNSANLNLKSWTDATTPVATELANRDYLSATNEVAMKARSFYAPAAPLALALLRANSALTSRALPEPGRSPPPQPPAALPPTPPPPASPWRLSRTLSQA